MKVLENNAIMTTYDPRLLIPKNPIQRPDILKETWTALCKASNSCSFFLVQHHVLDIVFIDRFCPKV